MKKIVLIALALVAAGAAVSTVRHGNYSQQGPPFCLPTDPSPPCPPPPGAPAPKVPHK